MAKIDTLFMTKTGEKPYHIYRHTYIAHIREYPPPGASQNTDQVDSSKLLDDSTRF